MMHETQGSKYVIPARQTGVHQSRLPSKSSSRRPSSTASLVSKDAFEPRWRNGLILAKPDVSNEFVQKAIKTFRQLPVPLQNLFMQAGCQIKLAKTLDQIFPEVCKENPLYYKSNPWEQSLGLTVHKIVGLPEYIKYQNSDKFSSYTKDEHLLDAERHELFHTFHNVTNILFNDDDSINSEFERAYAKDVSKLSAEALKKYAYYVRIDDQNRLALTGMKEICAELLAALHGGGCRLEHEELKRLFPNTTEYLQQASRAILKQFMSGKLKF